MQKEKKTEATKAKIMKAAMEEFGTKGYAGASLNNISSTGISKGLLYHNFENREELYLACVKKSFDELTAFLQEQNIGTDWSRYFTARMQFFTDHLLESHLFFEAFLQPPAELQERIREIKSPFDQMNQNLYKNILKQLPLRKNIKEEDALRYFTLMQEMFNGFFSSPACSGQEIQTLLPAHEEELSKFFDCLLYGIIERGTKE